MNDIAARLTERLTKAERDQSHPNVRPKDAATLILIDRTGPSPKVLLGRRHHGHKFLPGKFVFPGGKAEFADRRVQAVSPLDPQVEKLLMRRMQYPSRDKVRGIALAAIRETFEETGLLLGRKHAQAPSGCNGPWAAFVQAGVVPDLATLHFVARAITPPRRPKRFDTRFFAVDTEMIAGRIDGVVGPDTELVELVWLPIAQARTLDMPGITAVVLEELEARIKAGMPRGLPVPFYRMINRRFTREML